MTRPLKVGEYRKVKTWDELLATEGAELMGGDIRFPRLRFLSDMGSICGTVLQVDYVSGNTCLVTDVQYTYIAEFFTDDHYDENGNEVKQYEKVGTLNFEVDGESIGEFEFEYKSHSDYGIHLLVDKPDPLDQLEATTKQDIANSNKVLDRIVLMREIEALQVQSEDMNKLIETKLNELGVTHE